MSQDLFEDVVAEANFELSPGLEGSSPVVSSGVSSVGALSQNVQPSCSQESLFSCEFCGRKLKTKRGLDNHTLILHKLSEFNVLRCDVDFILSVVGDLCATLLKDAMENDFNDNNDVVKFIAKILEEQKSPNFVQFAASLGDMYVNAIGVNSKLLPSNQYEEFLCSVNKLLNTNSTFDNLRDQLSLIGSTCKPRDVFVGRVLFRLIHNLTEELYYQILHECRAGSSDIAESSVLEMTDEEKANFENHAGNCLRSYFRRIYKLSDKVWRLRSDCICDKFVSMGMTDKVDKSVLLDKDSWENGSVCLSPNALQCFLSIETCIKSLLKKNSAVTSEEIFKHLMIRTQEVNALDLWHSLTGEYLSDIDSMMFLSDFVSIFAALSIKLESEKLHREEEERSKMQKFALRHGMQKN